jgi:hypothetical protein
MHNIEKRTKGRVRNHENQSQRATQPCCLPGISEHGLLHIEIVLPLANPPTGLNSCLTLRELSPLQIS